MPIPVASPSVESHLTAGRREDEEAKQGLARDSRPSRLDDYIVAALAGVGGVLLIIAVPFTVGTLLGWNVVTIATVFGGYGMIYGCFAGSLHIILGLLCLRAAARARIGTLARGRGLLAMALMAVPSGFFLLGGLFDFVAVACLLAAGTVAELT